MIHTFPIGMCVFGFEPATPQATFGAEALPFLFGALSGRYGCAGGLLSLTADFNLAVIKYDSASRNYRNILYIASSLVRRSWTIGLEWGNAYDRLSL